ncbi:hypothetical protein DITRI_Ditri09bG0068900 [Diplodiscus trichospermus]
MISRYWRMRAILDWRANLFSIFVNNMSHRVLKGALCEDFSVYGRVMDIYIHSATKSNKGNEIMFAFVKYRFKSKMMKMIEAGNNKRIDGWSIIIIVKEAFYY